MFLPPGVWGAALQLAEHKWRELTTPAFVLISDLDPEEMQEVAQQLEQFHALFAGLSRAQGWERFRPEIHLFESAADFKRFTRNQDWSGYFREEPDRRIIALRRSGKRQVPSTTGILYHEYAHHMHQFGVFAPPVWLDEGLAELFSTVEVKPRAVRVGSPAWRATNLRDLSSLSLPELLAVSHDSPHYNEANRSGVFYTKSWLLTHYLFLGTGRPDPRFARFLQEVYGGADPATALTNSFALNLPSLEREITRYAAGQRFAWFEVEPQAGPEQRVSFPIRELTVQEKLLLLGRLAVSADPDAADKFFNRALTLNPGSAMAHAGGGMAAAARRDFNEADRRFGMAMSIDPMNARILLLRAATLEQRGDRDQQESLILEYLNSAIEVDPGNLQAHQRRALSCVRTGRQLKLGIESAQTVLAVAPNEGALEIALAFMRFRLGNVLTLSPRIRAIAAANHDHTAAGRALIQNARELVRLERALQESTAVE